MLASIKMYFIYLKNLCIQNYNYFPPKMKIKFRLYKVYQLLFLSMGAHSYTHILEWNMFKTYTCALFCANQLPKRATIDILTISWSDVEN